MWTAINKWVAANALAFSILFGGLKNFTADYVIQTKFESKKHLVDGNLAASFLTWSWAELAKTSQNETNT